MHRWLLSKLQHGHSQYKLDHFLAEEGSGCRPPPPIPRPSFMTAAAQFTVPEELERARQTPDTGPLNHGKDKGQIEHQTFKVSNADVWQPPTFSACVSMHNAATGAAAESALQSMLDRRHKHTVWKLRQRSRLVKLTTGGSTVHGHRQVVILQTPAVLCRLGWG